MNSLYSSSETGWCFSCLAVFGSLRSRGCQSCDSPVIRLSQVGDVVAGLELADAKCRHAETAEVAEVDDSLAIE